MSQEKPLTVLQIGKLAAEILELIASQTKDCADARNALVTALAAVRPGAVRFDF